MKILAIIPARGGSKGLPGKNIRPLCGKPLIGWTIDAARGIVPDKDICVSTDSVEIADTVKNYGLEVPFLRPKELATDTATTNDVLLHALEFYRQQGKSYDTIILLQPTSPLRTTQHIREALALYHSGIDMVVSVRPSHAAAVLCRENENGYVESVFNKSHSCRQSLKFWEYNGAIYVINVQSLLRERNLGFSRILKYEMSESESVDIDTRFDMDIVELILNTK